MSTEICARVNSKSNLKQVDKLRTFGNEGNAITQGKAQKSKCQAPGIPSPALMPMLV